MSSIDYSKLRSLTARKLISGLLRDGFMLDRKRGGHQHFRHPDGRRVTLTFHHPSDTFPFKTLRSMIEKQAQWDEHDLKQLGL